jgi:hypothetical protein
MKVIAAINGTMIAENMAVYAIKYAEVQNFSLVLLHVENEKDDISDVEASVKRISMLANSNNVQTQYIQLDAKHKKEVKTFLSTINADTIFCSTRKKKRFIRGSFSEDLSKMNLDADIAIVRIVKMSHMNHINTMMLSIKKDKLSVKKFAFFAALASAYKAEGEIYSVSGVSNLQFSRVDIGKIKEKLGTINFNLRHYIKLAQMMSFNLRIKHDFTHNESQSILSHVIKSDTRLLVVGANRLSVKSLFNTEMPIESLMRESSVNIIAFYTKED